MSQQDGERSKDLFRRFRATAASEFSNQCSRAKRQDWWTLSKMWVVFSVALILLSGVIIAIGYVMSVINNTETAVLISVASVVAGLGSYLFYIVATAFLTAVVGAASVATGNEEFLELESKSYRYIVHSGKLIVALLLLVGYHQWIFSETGSNVLEFLFIIVAITGLVLLPFGLLLWGVLGIYKERTELAGIPSQTE